MQAEQQALKAVGIAVLSVAWWGQMAGVNHCRLLMHANWAHLALNCWALWGLWRKPMWVMVPAVFIGWAGIAIDHNAIGFSAALFALMGLQWNLYDCTANRLLVAALLLISLIIPQMAFIAHILPFCIGLAAGCVYRYIKRSYNDMG